MPVPRAAFCKLKKHFRRSIRYAIRHYNRVQLFLSPHPRLLSLRHTGVRRRFRRFREGNREYRRNSKGTASGTPFSNRLLASVSLRRGNRDTRNGKKHWEGRRRRGYRGCSEGKPLNAVYRFLSPGCSTPRLLPTRLSSFPFCLPFAYSAPRTVGCSFYPCHPRWRRVSSAIISSFRRAFLPLASFSLGYAEFHAQCGLPTLAPDASGTSSLLATNRARGSPVLLGQIARKLVTTYPLQEAA